MSPGRAAAVRVPPAWRALYGHSLALAARWAVRCARARRVRALRAGLYRALVPLEPWRYYELARVAAHPFAGDCLDVASPKLLASALNARGRGHWTAVDLFAEEIARWQVLDPDLDLRVADARALPFADGAFDAIACISVIEHIPADGDVRAMEEMWRVLRPGGVLHLTTNVARRTVELWMDRPLWGDASETVGDRVFFERRYAGPALSERLLGRPWIEEEREYVRERRRVHERFFAARPWSFLAGPLLPAACLCNYVSIDDPGGLPEGDHAVAYLRLRKPV
jgi:SAM-dependent methyltransferase